MSVFFAFDIAFHILFVDGNQDENGRERRDEVLKAAASVNDMEKSEKIGIPFVEFQNVSFGYDEHTVLDHLNFKVMDTDQVTLLGRTGAGKSTILKLLLGLYEPEQGWGSRFFCEFCSQKIPRRTLPVTSNANVCLNHEIFIKGFSWTGFDAIILSTFLMSCFLKQAFHNH